MNEIDQLTKKFGQGDQIKISANPEGVAIIELNNRYAKVEVSTYGGQVLSFKPHASDDDVLFLSDKAIFAPGKAIRGGSPICWPWFGDDMTGFGRPSHGFARNQDWKLTEAWVDGDDAISARLVLTDTEGSLAVWPYPFELSLLVTLKEELTLALTTKNTGKRAFTLSQAIHTYFNVSQAVDVEVVGLEGKRYLDKLDNFVEKVQQDKVRFDQETDRVYQHIDNAVTLNDIGFNRAVEIKGTGSKTTIVWNPWDNSIKPLSDLNDSDYLDFVCIETANAAEDTLSLAEGEEHTLTARYRVHELG